MTTGSDDERERRDRAMTGGALGPTPQEDEADVRVFLAELRAAGVRDVRGHFVALAESEKRYREFADMLPEAVFEADLDGLLTYVNRVAVRLFGYTTDEVAAGITLEQIVKAPDRVGTVTTVDLRPSEGSTSVEYAVHRKDGSTVPVLVRMGPVMREERVVGLRGVIVDVTERKRHEQALRDLSTRLTEGIEAERRRVAALVHDEIGQNLATIGVDLASLNLAVGPTLTEPVRTRLTTTSRLVEEMMRTARTLVCELRPLLLEECGLPAALKALARQFANRYGVEVVERIQDLDNPRPAHEIEVHLFRIAQEALANVARHAAANRAVLALERRAASVRLSIEDDGKGFTVETVGPPASGGQQGLGLIQLRERATAAGGTVSIASAVGHGTKVVAEVPL